MKPIAGAAALFFIGAAAGAHAEEGTRSDDEIIVYGRAASDTVLTIPQSVDVLDASLIERTASETVGDALRFVPGASRDGSPLDAFGDTYLIRGFEANQTLNGLYANPLRHARDSIGIERIEVLKGPASVLYGQLQPGAVVNIVTKQPEREFAGAASLSYGRYDDWRGTVDVTGPLSEGGDIRFRLTGAYDDADSFVDFWRRKHVFVAPVLAVDLGEATTVTLEGFYTRNRLDGFFNGVPAAGSVLENPNGEFSRSLSLTDPTLPPSIRENANASLRVEHGFSDSIRWRAAVDWTHEGRDEASVLGVLGWDDEFRSLTRILLTGGGSGDNWTVHNDLALEFATGGFEHSLVIGGDYTWFDREGDRQVFFMPSLDLFDPVYAVNAPPSLFEVPSFERTVEESSRTAGVFLQDRITLSDNLKFVGGVRWSHFKEKALTVFPNASSTSTDRQSHTAWTSQLGLLYTPVQNIAFFANRTTSFLPTDGIAADGSTLAPETGTQYEVGAKTSLADGVVTLNASLFHLIRGDVVVADRDNPGFEISIGEQVAKGVEVSVNVQPGNGLTLYAGYAYTDAETTEDTDDTLVGKGVRNIPEHGLVLRGDYEWLSGPVAGLSLGGSATYTGEREGDLENTFDLPGYWRLDAHLDYPLTENIAIGASIENLTDERYYDLAFSEFEVWPGAPRTWRVNLTGAF